MARDSFSADTIRVLAERANMICSNPACKRMTGGYHTNYKKRMNLGKASHICAASPGGPRYDPSQTPQERRSIENAMWLCVQCADMIDKDEQRYPPQLLHEWKKLHEAWVDEQRETDVRQRRVRREQRFQLLTQLRQQIHEARREYLDYLQEYPAYSNTGDPTLHMAIINKAIDACMLAGDIGDEKCRLCLDFLADTPEFDSCSKRCEKVLAYIARLRLTPHFVTGQTSSEGPQQIAEVERWGRYEDRNKNALFHATQRFDELVEELSS